MTQALAHSVTLQLPLFCMSRNPLEYFTFRLLNHCSRLVQMYSKNISFVGIFTILAEGRYAGVSIFCKTDQVFSISVE